MPPHNVNTASTASTTNEAAPSRPAPDMPPSSGDQDVKKGFQVREKWQKPLKFHLAFVSILLMVFTVSIDATALAVVIPVSDRPLSGHGAACRRPLTRARP